MAFLLSEANLRQWTAFCTKNATYMAKMEFNTGIETLTIFLVSVVATVHERALFSLRSPAVPAAECDPQT